MTQQKKTLSALARSNAMLHKNLAQAVGLSSQALTWQMNRLKQTGLIEAEQEGMSAKYALKQASTATVKLLLGIVDPLSIKHF
jgi:predicted transcriptional regulator